MMNYLLKFVLIVLGGVLLWFSLSALVGFVGMIFGLTIYVVAAAFIIYIMYHVYNYYLKNQKKSE